MRGVVNEASTVVIQIKYCRSSAIIGSSFQTNCHGICKKMILIISV